MTWPGWATGIICAAAIIIFIIAGKVIHVIYFSPRSKTDVENGTNGNSTVTVDNSGTMTVTRQTLVKTDELDAPEFIRDTILSGESGRDRMNHVPPVYPVKSGGS